MQMTLKQAIEYLQPIADNAQLAGYHAALNAAMDAMREVEKLRRELEDERYRHDRQADFTVGQGEKIDRLKEQLRVYQEAEKDGRIVVPPVKVGDKLYSVTYDTVPKQYVIGAPEEIVEVGTRGFFFAWKTDTKYPVEFHPYEEIGQEFFLTLEDAMQAKERLEEVHHDY